MKKIILLVLTGLLLTFPVKSYAKTFAYLFAKDELIKIDTEADSITKRTKASDGVNGFKDLKNAVCAVDMVNKYWITGSLSPRGGFFVYDLQTLKLIKYVSFPDIVKEPLNLKIIYPQLGSKFYFAVEDGSLNNGEGGVISLAYDQKTFNYLGTVNNVLNDVMDENFWISEDQSKIYVESPESNLRVFASETSSPTNTVVLSNVYSTDLWSKSVKDIKAGVVLLKENKKAQLADKNNFSFLTYKIADGTTSPRFATGVDDKATLLTPNAAKIIINETRLASSSGAKAPVKGSTVTGRIHVYDVATGRKLGLVTLPADFGEKILGVRPQSDKLYYLKYSKDESNIRLYVVDLVGLKIIKEITVPNLFFMIFFEE